MGISKPLDLLQPMESTFVDILREPDLIRVFHADGELALEHKGATWSSGHTDVSVKNGVVSLHSTAAVSRIQLRWRGDLRKVKLFLGDHWERSYGDLEWRSEAPNRVMPWYFLAYDGKATHCYGVKTLPNAFCFWTADSDGISLWIDVRSGGVPVELAGRTLKVCEIVSRAGKQGETPFGAAVEFCKQMCRKPRLTAQRAYGTNDWDYAYGKNSAELIESVSKLISELSPDAGNRPYSVIDDGWSQGGLGHGPWLGNDKFGDMGELAVRLKKIGVRPGIWFRPLTTLKDQPDDWRLSRDNKYLDPTVPEAIEAIVANIQRLRGWGYEMIKHDFTGWDIFGRWGFSMGSTITNDGWHFHDRSRTSAEIVLSLYRTIREAAGDMAIIGCNTFGHLSAGLFELSRTGDDTSGVSWDRTRRMGVNTLAFRAAQNGTFFAVDPDIVAVTRTAPWDLTERWLRLVAGSGTALFVSIDPEAMGPEQKAALQKALAQAAKPVPTAEPLDWLETMCPRSWRLMGKKTEFDWMPPAGAWPFSD